MSSTSTSTTVSSQVMRAGNGIGDDEEDASPPIAFRKISRPSANRRQRKRLRLQNEDAAGTPSESSVATSSGHEDQESSENSTGTLNESASTRDSDEDQPEESVSERLERIRLLQMERSRARGCDAEELLRPVLEPSITQQKKKPVVSGLSHRTSTDESSGGSGAKYGLQASFAKETEHVPTNALMEKYIQEELKKELGAEVLGIVEQEENADVASHDTEHLLYQLPEHLQVKKEEESDQEDLEAGAASFGSVEEVALPIEVKMRNIEQTEAAKRALVEKRKQERLEREGLIDPTKCSHYQRFTTMRNPVRNRWRSERENVHADRPDGVGASQQQDQHRPRREQQATDGLAMARFKRFFNSHRK